jgi:hypothetical protein
MTIHFVDHWPLQILCIFDDSKMTKISHIGFQMSQGTKFWQIFKPLRGLTSPIYIFSLLYLSRMGWFSYERNTNFWSKFKRKTQKIIPFHPEFD